MIDGGKGQLSSACEILRGLGLSEIPIIGLAKRYEEIYLPGESESVVIDDWVIDKTARETEDDITTFETAFTSKTSRDYSWKPDSDVSIDVVAMEDTDLSYHFAYRTEGTKKEWYDYLKVWEGHKNNWYDYAKVWENSVTFERVE